MSSPASLKADFLLKQNRTKEAIKLLQDHLADYPMDMRARTQLALAHYLNHDLRTSRKMAEDLLTEYPMEFGLVNLLAEIDLTEEKYADAQIKVDHLFQLDPENPHYHLLQARLKEAQRYYDSALMHVNKALALDAENVDALNFKALLADRVGRPDEVAASVQELLTLDPENPTSIANHGLQLLDQGKTQEALERFQEALAIQASNPLARHGMQEALKSRFWIYRAFFQYRKFVSKLSGNQAWLFIIGTYIGYRILFNLAENSDGLVKILLTTLVVLIAASFLLSWVINPLMNLFLWSNRYGKVLLDAEAKTMARYTGLALLFSLSSIVLYFTVGQSVLLVAGAFFAGMMIPAGTFLLPTKAKKQQRLKYLGLIILIFGITGLILPSTSGNLFFWGAILGLLGYQFYFNQMMISEFSRKFE